MAANIITLKDINVIEAPAGDFWFENCSLIGDIWFEIDDADFDGMCKIKDLIWNNKTNFDLMGKLNVYLKQALSRVRLAKALGLEIHW